MTLRLPIPIDLAIRAEELQSVAALARVYRCHPTTVRRWLTTSGISTVTWRPRHDIERISAITRDDLAAHPTRDSARRALRIGNSTIQRLANTHNVVWCRVSQARAAVIRRRTNVVMDVADYLALANADLVIDWGAEYGAMHAGRRYSINRNRYTAAEIIERAVKMGYRP